MCVCLCVCVSVLHACVGVHGVCKCVCCVRV